jgi:23S rRNA pseudouridine1911/1915/1917 synthase
VSTRHDFVVPEALDGARIDRCLAELHPAWTRSRVRKLIDGGHVALDGRSAKAATVVRAGGTIVVLEPPPAPLSSEAEDIHLEIVFEDGDLLVLDKPAGLVIHPAAGNPRGTLVNALLHHCRDLSGIGGVERPGIVHRLDKDTTGLMVVAKTDRAHLALSIAFRQRRVEKTYLAICYGLPAEGDGVIDAPIRRHPVDRQRMAVARDGRSARTLYHLEEPFADTALLSCRLVTGRTHQIRVHLAHIGHALVGDPVYSGRQWRNLRETPVQAACRSFPRQALHAWQLGFVHPVTQAELRFEAPPPPDMADLIETLRRHRSNV